MEKDSDFKWETRLGKFKKEGYVYEDGKLRKKIINTVVVRFGRIIKHFIILGLVVFILLRIWFNIDDGGKGLIPDRQNTEWQAVRKGSLQHEIFIGENPIVWNDDDLIIKVNCKEEADKIKTAIPYCLFVSFEVAEGFDVDLYADVSAKIRQRVQIPNN